MTTLSGSHTLVLMCSLKPFHPHFYNFFLFAQILKQKKTNKNQQMKEERAFTINLLLRKCR